MKKDEKYIIEYFYPLIDDGYKFKVISYEKKRGCIFTFKKNDIELYLDESLDNGWLNIKLSKGMQLSNTILLVNFGRVILDQKNLFNSIQLGKLSLGIIKQVSKNEFYDRLDYALMTIAPIILTEMKKYK